MLPTYYTQASFNSQLNKPKVHHHNHKSPSLNYILGQFNICRTCGSHSCGYEFYLLGNNVLLPIYFMLVSCLAYSTLNMEAECSS
jgi:hypothetical protein